MATTKRTVAGRTPAPVAVAPTTRAVVVSAPPTPETEAQVADAYLVDRIYDALLERGEASKVSEITLEINNGRITFPLVRKAVGESPRFVAADRLWNLKARYLDTARTTERTLREVITAAGRPLSTAQIANELSAIYNRPVEVYFPMLSRMLAGSGYFRTPGGDVGLTDWLPAVESEDIYDVIADNDLLPADVKPFLAAAKDVTFGSKYADATYKIAAASGSKTLSHKVAGILAWRVQKARYNPLAHLLDCLADPRLVWITGKNGGRWVTRERADILEGLLESAALHLVGDESEEIVAPPVETAPEPVVAVETTPEPEPEPIVEAPKPLVVSDADLAALEQVVSDRGVPIDAAELLALQYEVVPGDASFKADVEALANSLRANARFQYVGADRFREPNSLPLFVFSMPEMLAYPDLQFVSMDGEIMDEEIEDEGFAGALRAEMQHPLAQDAGDDEGIYTGEAPADPAVARCVVKSHHKEIGTFPLCQFPNGFLPADAPVVEITIRDAQAQAHEVIINHELRLMFNLFGLYESIVPESGGVFLLHKTARPYEYRFETADEPDPQVHVATERLAELQALREHAEETGELATFDIACEILESRPKGLDFVQFMTEVNLVRRVTRRKLASILSNYYCFVQKAGTGIWRFDAKKRDLGTDRTKRKYIKR